MRGAALELAKLGVCERGACAYVLTLGKHRLLVNCGAGPDLDVSAYDADALSPITQVVIYFSDPQHTGALPHLARACPGAPWSLRSR